MKPKAVDSIASSSEDRRGSTRADREDPPGVPFMPASPRKRKLFSGEEAGTDRGEGKEGKMVGVGDAPGAGAAAAAGGEGAEQGQEEEGMGEGQGEGEGVLSPVLSSAAAFPSIAGLRSVDSPDHPRDFSPEPACLSPPRSISCCGSTGKGEETTQTVVSWYPAGTPPLACRVRY